MAKCGPKLPNLSQKLLKQQQHKKQSKLPKISQRIPITATTTDIV